MRIVYQNLATAAEKALEADYAICTFPMPVLAGVDADFSPEMATAIHPNYAQEISAADGITIAWEKVPYSQGGWAEWEDEQRESAYKVRLQPDGPIFLAREHLSYLTGWQEGSVRE